MLASIRRKLSAMWHRTPGPVTPPSRIADLKKFRDITLYARAFGNASIPVPRK